LTFVADRLLCFCESGADEFCFFENLISWAADSSYPFMYAQLISHNGLIARNRPAASMPLKFACPQCQSVISVQRDQTGKEVACPKCRARFRVPAAKSPKTPSGGATSKATASKGTKSSTTKPAATQSNVSSGLADALGELTESDFNRHSPFESVYAPPKPQATNHELIRRVADQDARKKKSSKGGDSGMPVVLVLYAMHNLLQALVFFAMIGLLAFAMNLLENFQQYIPFIGAGSTSGMITFGVLGTIMMATAIGILIKNVWGYVLATASYPFFCSVHIGNLVANRSDRNYAIAVAIVLVLALFLSTYFFRSGCRKFYRLKGWILPSAAAAGGAIVGAIFAGVLYSMGVF
jgi:DNA-directed RNA polymerase subunit M/transcription elongation factor TFIIS